MADIDDYMINGPLYGIVMEPGQFFLKEAMPADDERLYPVYEKCQQNHITLNLTFGGLYCAKLEYYNPIYLDRVALRFPDLRIVCVHAAGGKIVAQIYHAGWESKRSFSNKQPVSAVACKNCHMAEMAAALTIEQIEGIIQAFADCAKRAKMAGFDGVEIHGAHG